MSDYEASILKFLEESKELGIRIHNDYQQAKRIFESVEKSVNFESIITQSNSSELIKECNAFGSVMLDWIEQYPKILNEYRQILQTVIDDLKQIQGINISQSGNKVNITFDNKNFLYHFKDNIHSDSPNLVISEEDKTAITLEENKIVQEIAEILSLDLYILSLIGYIELLNNKHNIKVIMFSLKGISIVNSPELVKDLNVAASWWSELREMLEKLKNITKTAVQIDAKATKELEDLFNKESKMQARDVKLRAAKAGMSLLGNIALSFVPGSTAISAALEFYKQRHTYKEAIDILRK